MRVSDEGLVELCEQTELDIPQIQAALRKRYPNYDARPSRIESRIANLRKRGLLPLVSGNCVSYGETRLCKVTLAPLVRGLFRNISCKSVTINILP